ncbi:MAG: type 4a pilus biogenesis protein PilO [Bdellovibrionaceae bacterium]|nr:type 4a pilus biogenesis protein PilO [Pseudobdellovibrionaceae bacterium]
MNNSNFLHKLGEKPLPLFIFLGAFLTLLYWSSAYNDGSALENQINSLTQQIDAEQKKAEEIQVSKRELNRISGSVGQLAQQFEELSKKLPSSLTSVEVNRLIDNLVKASGIVVKSRKPLAVKVNRIVEEVPIEIQAEGSFAEIAKFIFHVAAAEKVMTAKNFKIFRKEKGDSLVFEGKIVGYRMAIDRAVKETK